ncbi:MAG TPA: RNA-binding cell elongation regulator Jag/EloR, partial [Candidatus Binataceae bacterium]|nr:RNA-binding cell elongation regulator Jag/EloR [Candidatus Binataceae bacterium]
RSGLLGLGARQAKVRIRRKPIEPPERANAAPEARLTSTRAAARSADDDEVPARDAAATRDSEDNAPSRASATVEEQSREALSMLNQILGLMGEKAEIRVAASDAEGIELEVKGDGSGILIGRHGQTLDALEYLINRLLARRYKDAAPIQIDTESYRARRRQQLERMALSMGEQAKRDGKRVTLEPMPPRDRRIIHLALKDDPLVTTRSAGSGYMRALEIVPAEGRRERGSRERPQEREPLGQQGGFKRGQKKIV